MVGGLGIGTNHLLAYLGELPLSISLSNWKLPSCCGMDGWWNLQEKLEKMKHVGFIFFKIYDFTSWQSKKNGSKIQNNWNTSKFIDKESTEFWCRKRDEVEWKLIGLEILEAHFVEKMGKLVAIFEEICVIMEKDREAIPRQNRVVPRQTSSLCSLKHKGVFIL